MLASDFALDSDVLRRYCEDHATPIPNARSRFHRQMGLLPVRQTRVRRSRRDGREALFLHSPKGFRTIDTAARIEREMVPQPNVGVHRGAIARGHRFSNPRTEMR